jgi:hypothetical protein
MNGSNALAESSSSHCWFCGRASERRTLLRPKLRGGREQRGNLVPTCRRCEHAKGLCTAEEFREILRRTLVENDVMSDGPRLRFPGEGGPRIDWPKPVGRRGRPRKPAEKAGIPCRCGRWIPASRIAAHLSVCRA